MRRHSKKILISGGFVLFGLGLLVTGAQDMYWNALLLGLLMVYFWILEVIPIYVTALFPLIFASPLGLLDGAGLAKSYGNTMVFLFLGGFMLALALEKWEIHIQIAKRILAFVGKTKARILLGFLLSTSLLSMWISNTATALMMLPMALAVLRLLPSSEKQTRFTLFLMLSIAYGANIGGMATLVGSPPNLQMASVLNSKFDTSVGFVEWMIVGMPITLLLLLIVYLVFLALLGKNRNEEITAFQTSYSPFNDNQKKVLWVFAFVVFAWSFRQLITEFTGFTYTDESAALLGTLLLFLVPSDEKKNLLEWNDTEKLPWGILLLFGGGLAMAEGLSNGGVIQSLSSVLSSFGQFPNLVILLILVTIAIFGTEFMSNLALVTVFIPVIALFAQENAYDILQLSIPVTLAASCAFMLPVGTPPNAIVFSSGQVKIKQMALIGLVFNLLSAALISIYSWLFM